MKTLRVSTPWRGLCLVVSLFLLLSAVGLAAGCGGETDGQGGGTSGIVTYVYPRPPITDWDPAIEAVDGAIVLQNVYETLLRYDPDTDTFTPLLATEYSSSSDGLTWTFTIRQGVKFHDGTTLDAAAVKFSVERCIKLNKGVAYIWAPVDTIETPDDYTVVFNLKYPAPLDLIAASTLGAYIVSPTAVQSNPDGWLTEGHEAGTGPYTLKSWKMDQQVVLSLFAEYWQGWEGDHFDTAVVQRVSESTTRRQMIEAGEADIATELPVEDFEALTDSADITVDESASFRNLLIALNTKKSPLDDVAVRQALSYLFPYQEAIDSAAGGYATQARGGVPAGMWGTSDAVFQYTYDPQKAKQLLSDAGYKPADLQFEAVYASGDELERRCLELYKAALADVGVNLKLRAGPWESIWEQAKSKNAPQDMYIMYWYPTYCDPYDFLFNLFHTEKEPLWNLSYWSNPEFDKTIDDATAKSAVDRKAATEMFIDAQSLAQEDAPWICLLDKRNVAAIGKTLVGFKNNAAYQDVVFFYECSRQP